MLKVYYVTFLPVKTIVFSDKFFFELVTIKSISHFICHVYILPFDKNWINKRKQPRKNVSKRNSLRLNCKLNVIHQCTTDLTLAITRNRFDSNSETTTNTFRRRIRGERQFLNRIKNRGDPLLSWLAPTSGQEITSM